LSNGHSKDGRNDLSTNNARAIELPMCKACTQQLQRAEDALPLKESETADAVMEDVE
jgi:hypothetical protein